MIADTERLRQMGTEVLCPRCSRVTEHDGSCLDCGMSAAQLADHVEIAGLVAKDFAAHSAKPRKTKPVGQRESDILAAIRLALGKDPRVVLWRNNTGMLPAATRTGTRPLAYGLCKGSADLIGIVRIEGYGPVCDCTAETAMIRDCSCWTNKITGIGRFLALEVKTDVGNPTAEQLRFLALVNSFGGYGAIVRSVEEAQAAVDAAARGDVAT